MPMLSYMSHVYHLGVDMVLNVTEAYSRGRTPPAPEQLEDKSEYWTFPTSDELDDYRQRGLRPVGDLGI